MSEIAVFRSVPARGGFQAACRLLMPMRQVASVPEAAGMDSADWDLLFRAVLETLAQVAVEKPPPERAALRLPQQGHVLCECMDALDRLRRTVPIEPHRPVRPTPADGARAT